MNLRVNLAIAVRKPERSHGMQQLLVGNYFTVYMVSKAKIIILRVIYSSSDISTRLHED